MDITQVLRNVQVATFVPPKPISMYKVGGQAFKQGKPLSACITDEMTRGWLDAENAAAWAYFNGMAAEGMASLAVSL